MAHGGEASQTFNLLVLTNTTAKPCSVEGYPRIRAVGRTANRPASALDVTLSHGSYFRPDPGPHQISLRNGEAASCVLETSLGYSGGANPETITELTITAPGATGSNTIPVALGASGPLQKPIPIMITALVAGTAGPPQTS